MTKSRYAQTRRLSARRVTRIKRKLFQKALGVRHTTTGSFLNLLREKHGNPVVLPRDFQNSEEPSDEALQELPLQAREERTVSPEGAAGEPAYASGVALGR